MDSVRYAGFWRRIAAVTIDAILLSTLMLFGLVAWISLTGEAHAWDSTPMWKRRFWAAISDACRVREKVSW